MSMPRLVVSLALVVAACSATSGHAFQGEVDGAPGGGDGSADPAAPRGISDSSTAVSPTFCNPGIGVYRLDESGALNTSLFVDLSGDNTTVVPLASANANFAGSTFLANGNGVLYTIDPAGALHWYRNTWGQLVPESDRVIANGWNQFVSVIGGGDGVFYAISQSGELLWFRHLNPYGGSADWRGPVVLGSGWGDYARVVGGADGVLYAIDHSGSLKWFRHADPFGGAAAWAPSSGTTIGEHWDSATDVLAGGGGVLYAIMANGDARYYRHLDPEGGAAHWQNVDGKVVATALPHGTYRADNSGCTIGDFPAIPHDPTLMYPGMHPGESDALRVAGLRTDLVNQTISDLPASAGTHLQDGVVNGLPYGCAVDLSTIRAGWSTDQIRSELELMARVGVAGWYRHEPDDHWTGQTHAHVVFVGALMNVQKHDQIVSWLAGRNGLASDADYLFYNWSADAIRRVRKLFLANNPGCQNNRFGVYVCAP